MGWNGLDLVNDFSAELGDTSPAFKTKVLRWVNDGIKEICSSHQWSFLREKGAVEFVANEDTQSIVLAKPSAPNVGIGSGGVLTQDSVYKVLITFYEGASGVESIAGDESAVITPTSAIQKFTVSSVPVSSSPLVTARKVYVSKDGAAFVYHGTIPDNDALSTYDVTVNPSSSIYPPDENMIQKIDGDFYLSNNQIIEGVSLQDIIFKTHGTNQSGTPCIWAAINQEEIRIYPIPSAAVIASFYYFKIPARVYGTNTSFPEMPSWLYPNLRDYVIWRGYEYRDRAGKESKKMNFDEGLRLAISRKSKPTKKSEKVRITTPDSDGII